VGRPALAAPVGAREAEMSGPALTSPLPA
jgi:hypothetical protein